MPTGDYTQRDVADYTVRLNEAAVTCKVRLNAVDNILDDAEAQIEALDTTLPPM